MFVDGNQDYRRSRLRLMVVYPDVTRLAGAGTWIFWDFWSPNDQRYQSVTRIHPRTFRHGGCPPINQRREHSRPENEHAPAIWSLTLPARLITPSCHRVHSLPVPNYWNGLFPTNENQYRNAIISVGYLHFCFFYMRPAIAKDCSACY